MKNLRFLPTIIALLGILSCNSEKKLTPVSQITGQWEAIEYHYNIGGGPDQIQQLDPGFIFVFNTDQSFSQSMSSDCDSGTFSDESNILTLTYVCNNVTETIRYRYSIFEEVLTMRNITGSICTEGCATKYRYIQN